MHIIGLFGDLDMFDSELSTAAPAPFRMESRMLTDAARYHPLLPPKDFISTVVRMSRCMYAQLRQLVFNPHKGHNMPGEDPPLSKAADLGLKVTTGLELLVWVWPHIGLSSRSSSGLIMG